MNFLSKTITSRFFLNEDGYSTLTARWAVLAKAKTPMTPSEQMAYAILRGKDWRKIFTPITNTVKLANGQNANAARNSALFDLRFYPSRALSHPVFAGLLTPEAAKLIQELLQSVTIEDSAYRPLSVTAPVQEPLKVNFAA